MIFFWLFFFVTDYKSYVLYVNRAGLLERMPPMEKKEEKHVNGDVNEEVEERKRMKPPSMQQEVSTS